MFKSFVFVAALSLCLAGANAAETKKTAGASREVVSLKPSSAPWVMDLGAGMAVFSSTAWPGVSVGVRTRVVRDLPLYVGGDTGGFFHVSRPFTVLFPVQAAVHYVIEASPKVHPYAGLGVGIFIGTGNGFDLEFGLNFKPGVALTVARNTDLFFEPRLGLIGSTFAFTPIVGANFAI